MAAKREGGNGHISISRHRKSKLLALAITPMAAMFTHSAFAATRTWDSSGVSPATPADGSGNWNTTTGVNWSDGAADSAWVSGNIANIGSNGNAGTITTD